MKSVIFDLDQTLVDSSNLQHARHQRNWSLVYSLIPQSRLYPGMDTILKAIKEKGFRIAIVSTAPRPYVEKMLAFHHIPADCIVAYHDAKPIKPHPAPMFKALELLNASPNETISFGDRAIDILSSRSAGIWSVACFWGSDEGVEKLLGSQPDCAIKSPGSILAVLDKFFNKEKIDWADFYSIIQ